MSRWAGDNLIEGEKGEALESAVTDARMSRWREKDLIGEEDLRARDAEYWKEAIFAFAQHGSQRPIFKNLLENSQQALYEEPRDAREAIERDAAMQLKHALSSAAAGYDIQMSRWIEGPLVDEEELRARDAECRRGALATLFTWYDDLGKMKEEERKTRMLTSIVTLSMMGGTAALALRISALGAGILVGCFLSVAVVVLIGRWWSSAWRWKEVNVGGVPEDPNWRILRRSRHILSKKFM
ncbi:unnamed protein product [Darwinula stevensoni]|uniref:Uncharacterized protein n=1 Tax=Darwinula stevensoni TaxID=69355 RepID=A0A7R8XAP9_9CRUS|nr:unnamed protein product [Darwinula stevensoni]CAG0892111.1 unnamed protein product [Darwinula stevensoni]